MSPIASWCLVLVLLAAAYGCVYALMRVASRCSRFEEEIVRQYHRLDNGLLVMAMRHKRLEMGDEMSDAGQVGPSKDAA